MTGISAYEEIYDLVQIFGRPALFTCLRLDRKTVPEEMYAYDIRYDDDDERAAEVAKFIFVNHMGTIITKEEIDFKGESGLELEKYDFGFEGVSLTLDEFERGEYEHEIEYE